MTAADDVDVLRQPGGFGQVVLVTGHLTDEPTRFRSRFPEHAVPAVAERIERTLTSWRFGEGDLLISGGARGADLLAATIARRMGATVWLLLGEPPAQFEKNSVAGGADEWIDQFRATMADTPTWVLEDDWRVDGLQGGDDHDAVYVATNEWMLRVAVVQADGRPLRVLAVWDGLEAEGPGGAADMVDAARRMGADVTIVDPGR